MSTAHPDRVRLVAGCMTGTSIDSLDAALVRIHGRGLTMRAELVRTITRPLGDLAPHLRTLAEQRPMTAGAIACTSQSFSVLHLETLQSLLGNDTADLIAVHGQTVFHAPPVSWQLLTPAVIAYGMGVPVVSDLRAADLVRWGQGAPITPIADSILFRGHSTGPTAIVNLGGFCNITIFTGTAETGGPVDPILGFDLCACNHLLDGIARQLFDAAFDAGGARAAGGTVHGPALDHLCAILIGQQRVRMSLGTGHESSEWISTWKARMSPDDLAATACESIARTIATRIGGIELILLAGGGVKNKALTDAIRARCSTRVEATDAVGVPAEYREAVEMAVLGALCQDRVPITLPQVTGVRGVAPIAGTWVLP